MDGILDVTFYGCIHVHIYTTGHLDTNGHFHHGIWNVRIKPLPELLTHRLLLHPQRRHERQHTKRQRWRLGSHGCELVARAHLLGQSRLQVLDTIQALADPFLNLTGFVTVRQASRELRAEHDLQDGGADTDTSAATEGTEEI